MQMKSFIIGQKEHKLVKRYEGAVWLNTALFIEEMKKVTELMNLPKYKVWLLDLFKAAESVSGDSLTDQWIP